MLGNSSIYRGKTAKEIYLANLLYEAIDDEDIKSINTFLVKGADCNLVLPKRQIAPFHLVIGKDSEEFATKYTSIFLQNKADPNLRTDDGLTPLHISAAYGRIKILNTLLLCGGNPDIRDSNFKKPIDYAKEHGHEECADLLLSFMEKQNLFSRNELEPAFNFSLEKIIVENGNTTGDYEIINEYKTEPSTQKTLELLQRLPETDTTEYVMKWCENHLTNTHSLISSIDKIPESSFNDSDFNSTSCNESDGGKSVNYVTKGDNITFRKKYRKTRNIKPKKVKKFTSSPIKESPITNTPIDKTNTEMFSIFESFSKESGIMSLPSSKDELSLTENKNQNNCNENIEISSKENSSNNSTYITCSSGNDTRILQDKFMDNTKDIPQFSEEEMKMRKSSTKSEGVLSTDVSFVSVSEIYKYIDEEEDVVLYEKRLLKAATSDYAGSIKSSLSSVLTSDYDTDTLRKELTTHGFNPGPITFTTKRVYLRKLKQIKKNPIQQITNKVNKKTYSVELEKTFKDPHWIKDAMIYKSLEEMLVIEFSNPNPTRKWREGCNKTSFTYLLLDPRITNNLPCRADCMEPKELWEVFLSSIFYVGKGKRSRPYSHLYEAVKIWKEGKKTSPNKKLDKILQIWKDNNGVICLHIFQNVIPVEAYTREAAIIDALKIENLDNIKNGDFYGITSTWSQRQKKMLGAYLLYKAMMIFINEGERQLCPSDIE